VRCSLWREERRVCFRRVGDCEEEERAVVEIRGRRTKEERRVDSRRSVAWEIEDDGRREVAREVVVAVREE